jgi:uncharacterized protein (DUF1015 family)
MARIKPFKGYTPTQDSASNVASPPYDVMNADEARVYAADKPLSFIRVVKSELEFPKGASVTKDDIYKKGAENLQNLISTSNLVRNNTECYYLYRQQMGEHIQTGIVAGASVDEYNQNIIKKHENTLTEKEIDRANHVDSLNANAGPVFLTYHSNNEIDNVVNQLTANLPKVDFTAEDGIKHTLWTVDNPQQVQQITDLFATNVPYMYVADGHHRSAAASHVQKRRLEQNPTHTGNEQYNFFLTVIFPDDQMYIMDYNRALKEYNGHTPEQIMTAISEKFNITELNVTDAEQAKPKARGNFAMYIEGKWYNIEAKTEIIPTNDPVNSLDVAVLQNNVLQPIFDIENPKTDKRIDFIGGIRGLKELERRCNTDCKVAFGCFPTGIDQLIAIADANEVMPPKSTWFEPKLRSGMVVRTLDD